MSQSFVMEATRASAVTRTGRNLLSAWARSPQTWFMRRQGWHELNSLDDRLLRDVGFSREDLRKGAEPSYGSEPCMTETRRLVVWQSAIRDHEKF